MEPIELLAAPAAAALVTALFSAVWQGAVVAACVAASLRLLPRLSAAARSAIWMYVFLLLLLLHLLPAFAGRAPGVPSGRFAPLHLDPRWSVAIALAWALLSLWKAARLIASAVRLHRMASRATPVRPGAALSALLRGSGRSVELCTSPEVERPSVFGFFRPRILLPPDLAGNLSPLELEQVVLHELEHLRRADDWTNLLQKLALVLFPLNPALGWVERRLCAERELACDDRVLRSSPSPKAYAICLTRLAEYSMLRRSLSLVLGAWERRSELVRRVQRILARPTEPMSRGKAMVLTGSLSLGVLACVVALARSPQLVSFAPLIEPAQQAHFAPVADLEPAAVREMGPTPQLVKAVMPMGTGQTPPNPKPKRAAAHKRAAKPQPVPSQQAWIVLTGWTDSDSEPAPRLVFAVDRENRLSFAAVEFANGWLIVQI